MLRRLTRSEDFERVRKAGLRWRGRYCSLNVATAESNEATTRVGYIAAKSVGGAVQRNRARRLMKEATRALANHVPTGWDIVLIAQPSLITEKARMQQVQEDVLWLLNKAQAQQATIRK